MLNALHIMSKAPLVVRPGRHPKHALVSLSPTHLNFLSVEIRLRVKASWEERRKMIAEEQRMAQTWSSSNRELIRAEDSQRPSVYTKSA